MKVDISKTMAVRENKNNERVKGVGTLQVELTSSHFNQNPLQKAQEGELLV